MVDVVMERVITDKPQNSEHMVISSHAPFSTTAENSVQTPRLGPRAIEMESTFMQPVGHTGGAPFKHQNGSGLVDDDADTNSNFTGSVGDSFGESSGALDSPGAFSSNSPYYGHATHVGSPVSGFSSAAIVANMPTLSEQACLRQQHEYLNIAARELLEADGRIEERAGHPTNIDDCSGGRAFVREMGALGVDYESKQGVQEKEEQDGEKEDAQEVMEEKAEKVEDAEEEKEQADEITPEDDQAEIALELARLRKKVAKLRADSEVEEFIIAKQSALFRECTI
eukprot:TRINITY_DN46183_c0_g1_i1.p1 TRINITY_DN46183_c0_g1~~TRINITY_DN46183_c0_g1_i1.p1  ORF type:complete len:304 (-),score=80.57 TRINITY_DN46183_c0_g1_i1:49-897(-)